MGEICKYEKSENVKILFCLNEAYELYESQITLNIHLNIQKSQSFVVRINDAY